MRKKEIMRRLKLIEQCLNGGIEIEFKNAGIWSTLTGDDYSIVMIPGIGVREKSKVLESWANVYSGYVSYHPSAARSLDVAMPSVVRTAVHMKEVK